LRKFYRVNNSIQAANLRLIDEEGKNLGIVSREEALALAKEKNLDLVEISPKENPPVAKIMDFGQFKYQLKKKEQKQKSKQKKTEIKGIRLSLRISEHDKEFKLKQGKKFLEQGHKVKIEMILKGREKIHLDLAKEIINQFIEQLGEVKIEQEIKKQGGKLTAIVSQSK